MQNKKNTAVQEFRRNRDRDRNQRFDRNPKSRQVKPRLKTKEVFLTDTQTSDYTKSSGEMGGLKIQYLQNQIKQLQKQNHQLKKAIIDMKTGNYIQINEEKVKQLITQNQKSKKQIDVYKRQLQQSLLQRDFLIRFNKNLKIQCQSLTKQLIQLKSSYVQHSNHDSKNRYQYGCNSQSEQIGKLSYRSASTEIILTRKRQPRKKQSKMNTSKRNHCTSPTTPAIDNYFMMGSQTSGSSFGMKNKKY